MRTGEAAELLGLDGDTLKNWMKRDEFKQFFSAEALGDAGKPQRQINDNDLLILNTIRDMRSSGNNNWYSIAQQIESGYLTTEFPATAAFVEGTSSALTFTKTVTQSHEIALERDKVVFLQQQILELQNQRISDIRTERDGRESAIARIHEDISQLQKRIGALERENELLRAGWLPPSAG